MAATALLIGGCAQRIVEPASPRRPAVARPPVAAPAARPGPRPGFVIAAPDGAGDEIAAELARRTGFTLATTASTSAPIAFYAEIVAGSRPESAGRIEITTAGVDESLAVRLRTLYELIRDAHLRGSPGTARVDVRIEPADVRVSSTGLGAPVPVRTLRLELPRVARTDAREPYLTILAEFLTQAAALPAGR